MSTTTASSVSPSVRTFSAYEHSTTYISNYECNDPEVKVADHTVINGSSTVVFLFKDLTDLIPCKGPLTQVLNVTNALNSVVGGMYDDTNKITCEYLVERVLVFLKNLVEDSKRAGVSLQSGSPAAAKLFVLSL